MLRFVARPHAASSAVRDARRCGRLPPAVCRPPLPSVVGRRQPATALARSQPRARPRHRTTSNFERARALIFAHPRRASEDVDDSRFFCVHNIIGRFRAVQTGRCDEANWRQFFGQPLRIDTNRVLFSAFEFLVAEKRQVENATSLFSVARCFSANKRRLQTAT